MGGIKISFTLPVVITKRERWVVAACPALDIISQGATEREAKANLTEALHLFFESCIERGTLFEVLKDCGFSPAETGEQVIESVPSDDVIDIPVYLLAKYAGENQCHPA